MADVAASQQQSQNGSIVRLTSTTAPNKIFHSREELAQHYKSDWHKYNCKRKEAGLPMLREEDFQARLQAALAVKQERENKQQKDGTNHLKKNKERQKPKTPVEEKETTEEEVKEEPMEVEEEPPVIDPCQSLFDSTMHPTVRDNVEYMQRKYGFFIPDAEYLTKLSNLIGYCQEKILIGQMCLYCQKGFKSPRAVKDHMIDSRHTKILYEEGVDLWEYEPFYDFSEANKEFWESWKGKKPQKTKKETNSNIEVEQGAAEVDMESVAEEDDTEWEDVTDSEDEDDDEAMKVDGYKDYQANMSQYGFDVTPYGELIFPDGRIVGHRALSRYYKQRLGPMEERAAVKAARMAAGERYLPSPVQNSANHKTNVPKLGRNQAGILVSASGGGFTTLSLYRHRAVVKKSRREEAKSRRLQQRTSLPMNKMDKKGNRLKNNVSVAHAPR